MVADLEAEVCEITVANNTNYIKGTAPFVRRNSAG